MTLIKRIITTIGCLLVGGYAHAAAFYFVAHPDDVELFMARQAWSDVKAGAKVVFVVTTAGDGGLGTGHESSTPGTYPYYLARENAHVASIEFWYNRQGNSSFATWTENVAISGMGLQRRIMAGGPNRVILYNLRLPDGKLEKFRNDSLTNPTTPITAVDGSGSYTWTQLKSLLKGIILYEQDNALTWVNIPEVDLNFDHSDHITTGRVVTHALEDYAMAAPPRCIKSVEYVGYAAGTNNWPENYQGVDRTTHLDTWNVLNDTRVAYEASDTRDAAHAKFLYRMYQTSIKHYGPC